MANSALIRVLCDALIEFMPKPLQYDENKWLAASDDLNGYLRPDDFAQGPRRKEPPKTVYEVDLRYVLYAAWFARWSTAEIEADKIRTIAAKAANLCREAIKRRDGSDLPGDMHGSYDS